MKKIRFELESWDEGKAFINRLADEFGLSKEKRDQNWKLEHDDFSVNCHFDDREFSFILIKLENERLETKIMTILKQFKAN